MSVLIRISRRAKRPRVRSRLSTSNAPDHGRNRRVYRAYTRYSVTGIRLLVLRTFGKRIKAPAVATASPAAIIITVVDVSRSDKVVTRAQTVRYVIYFKNVSRFSVFLTRRYTHTHPHTRTQIHTRTYTNTLTHTFKHTSRYTHTCRSFVVEKKHLTPDNKHNENRLRWFYR